MSPRRRYYISMLSIWLGTGLGAGAAPVYLSTVGPAPFRFQAPPRPPTRPTPPAPALVGPESAPVSTATNTPPPAVTNTAPPPAADTNALNVVNPPKSDEVVSPQMLLKYFNRSTNGIGSEVITPLTVPLPSQSAPPASKATYSN